MEDYEYQERLRALEVMVAKLRDALLVVIKACELEQTNRARDALLEVGHREPPQ